VLIRPLVYCQERWFVAQPLAALVLISYLLTAAGLISSPSILTLAVRTVQTLVIHVDPYV
jgi:hypothetical protein